MHFITTLSYTCLNVSFHQQDHELIDIKICRHLSEREMDL